MKTKQLQSIMHMAWHMVKTNGYTMSKALKKAWQVAKLKVRMAMQVVRFTFLKTDGTTREAFGTLELSRLPQTPSKGKTPSKAVQVYWDTVKMAWRCFKIENLVCVD